MGLTLRRTKGESVILKTSDGDIEIMSLRNQTTLNIIAPKSVGIWRKELLDDDNQLLPRDRGAKSVEQDEQGVHLQRCLTSHTPVDQETPQT